MYQHQMKVLRLYVHCLSCLLVITKHSGYKFCNILTPFQPAVKTCPNVLYGSLRALLMHASILVYNLTYFSTFSPDRQVDGLTVQNSQPKFGHFRYVNAIERFVLCS